MSAVVVFPFFGNSVRTSRSTLSNKSDRSSVRTSGGTRVSGSVAHLRDLVPPPLEEDEDECPEESTGMYFSLSNNEGGFEEEEPTPVSPSQRIRFIRARRTSDFKSDRSSSSSSSSNSSSGGGGGGGGSTGGRSVRRLNFEASHQQHNNPNGARLHTSRSSPNLLAETSHSSATHSQTSQATKRSLSPSFFTSTSITPPPQTPPTQPSLDMNKNKPNNDGSGAVDVVDPKTRKIQFCKSVSRRMKNTNTGVLITDRRLSFELVGKCFAGTDAVDWMVENTPCKYRHEAVELGQQLLLFDLIYHVSHTIGFQDDYALYRFTNEHLANFNLTDVVDRLKKGVKQQDRKYHFKSYSACFVASEAVDFLMTSNLLLPTIQGRQPRTPTRGRPKAPPPVTQELSPRTREEAVSVLDELMCTGHLRHVCGEPTFRDGYFFYTFAPSSVQQLSSSQIDSLILRMRDGVRGVAIKDRYSYLKLYKSCFVGKEALSWIMVNTNSKTTASAMSILSTLLYKGVISLTDGSFSTNFQANDTFYSIRHRVLRAGYLRKRGKVNNSLKMRWFILEEQNLWYTLSPEDNKQLGSIPLGDAYARPFQERDGEHYNGGAFEVVTADRIFFLVAKSQESMILWVRAISSLTTNVLTENQLIEAAEDVLCSSMHALSLLADYEEEERDRARLEEENGTAGAGARNGDDDVR